MKTSKAMVMQWFQQQPGQSSVNRCSTFLSGHEESLSGVHLNKPHMKMLTYRKNFMQLCHTRKQLDAVHTIIHYFFKIQFNIILLFMYALHAHN